MPFFVYYGGKHRTGHRYPAPEGPRIIEPFAGSAGYSVRRNARHVHLYDASEQIVGVWSYLISAKPEEIRALPVGIEHVSEALVCQEARWLIGFWLNKGTESPRLAASSRFRSGLRPNSHWGPVIRERLARQVDQIRHWTITLSSYEDVPLRPATWFVDPPYWGPAGAVYRHAVEDYDRLGEWCRDLPGQVIVCEQVGAPWLPFEPTPWIAKWMRNPRGSEAMWTNRPGPVQEAFDLAG